MQYPAKNNQQIESSDRSPFKTEFNGGMNWKIA